MENIHMEVVGKILTITVDLNKEVGVSASGKSILIATTSGNAPVPDSDGAIAGINIFRKR